MYKIIYAIIFCLYVLFIWRISDVQSGKVMVLSSGASTTTTSIASTTTTAAGPTHVFHIEFDSDTAWGTGGYTIGGNDYSAGDQVGDVTAITQESAQAVSGSYSALSNAVNEYMRYAITASDTFRSLQGFMETSIYPLGFTGYNSIFDVKLDSNDYLYVYTLQTTGGIVVDHNSGGNVVGIITTATCTVNQWCQVQVKWDMDAGLSGSTEIGVRVCSDGTCDAESWEYESDGTNGTAFNSGEPTYFSIGEKDSSDIGVNQADGLYIDNLSIWLNADQS